ncbi:MAG TPA: endolytic transglycosylase MltG [Nitrospiraceae bacterium]|jgi:UPF0755 protein|nr:endolytic transglycosylase MltG [Nitrospiraceae bacterium]
MKPGSIPLLIGAALCIVGFAGYHWMTTPLIPYGDPGPSRIVDIPEGSTFRQVAILLEKEGMIASQWAFLLLGKLTRADRRILAGEYALHPGMRPTDILTDLQSGRMVLHSVTIPEGYTADQIADLLEQRGLAQKDEFVRLVHDRTFIQSLNLETASLEGYLFPNTYRFPRHKQARDLISIMVAGLWQAFTPEFHARARDVNMTPHQVLTLASLIEKETSVGDERPLISAVFHNRLKRYIPLQSDPTVIYGLSAFNGNLTKRDLAVASPYNTYRVAGLPPGPIANPGADSIRAALYPAATTYLYFVSRNDGTHKFSSTLVEHNRAVEKYQPVGRRDRHRPAPRSIQAPS